MMAGVVLGVDFDNTIATYDGLFHRLAVERGLIGGDVPCRKRHVRDAVRRLEDGESHWQRLQALAYGPHMADADMAEGVAGFLVRCLHSNTPVHVVSHRTAYAAADPAGVALRDAALQWMRA